MANIAPHVLKMLSETTAKEVEQVTEALAKVMKYATEAQSKYDMLQEYRREYLKSLTKSLEQGMSAESHQNFHSFLAKLDQAVAGQLDVLTMARAKVEVQKQLWQEAQRKKLSYEVLTKRSTQKKMHVENKKSQKDMDEFAMRASYRK
jgi:flagellar FliJ protein